MNEAATTRDIAALTTLANGIIPSTIATMRSLCLVLMIVNPAAAQTPNANAVIRAKAGGSEIVVITTERLAGAIHSLRWNGKEFIDSADHGRQLQSACAFQLGGGRFNAETYNPTEAGSRKDGAGPASASRLLHLSAKDNILETKIRMAFWLAPGEKSRSDPARNTQVLSDHIVSKRVVIGVKDLPNVLDYSVTFRVPEGEKANLGQFEALTGYMPEEFQVFHRLDPTTGKLLPLDDGPGEQPMPVILATADGKFAMGILSIRPKGFGPPGYGRWRFKRERVVKWNTVFRLRDPDAIASGDYAFRNFVPIGTLEDVRSSLTRLVEMFR